MNDLIMSLGLESWKGLISVLILPPVPLIVLVLVGARLMFRRRALAWLLILLGGAGLWTVSTSGLGKLMRHTVHVPPPALSACSAVAGTRSRPSTGSPT